MGTATFPTWEVVMGGVGRPPKDPDQRARRNKDPIGLKVIHAEPVAQPDLPSFEVEHDGELVEFVWPARTQQWWQMWAESPLSDEFTQTDWDFLLDTAVLHAKYWKGAASLAGELRLRVAKFGATPEDRARLRITFAQADEADDKVSRKRPASKRYKGLRLADGDALEA